MACHEESIVSPPSGTSGITIVITMSMVLVEVVIIKLVVPERSENPMVLVEFEISYHAMVGGIG